MVDLINELLNSEDSCSGLHTSETSLSLLDYIEIIELMQSRLSCQAFVGPYHVYIVCWLHSQNN